MSDIGQISADEWVLVSDNRKPGDSEPKLLNSTLDMLQSASPTPDLTKLDDSFHDLQISPIVDALPFSAVYDTDVQFAVDFPRSLLPETRTDVVNHLTDDPFNWTINPLDLTTFSKPNALSQAAHIMSHHHGGIFMEPFADPFNSNAPFHVEAAGTREQSFFTPPITNLTDIHSRPPIIPEQKSSEWFTEPNNDTVEVRKPEHNPRVTVERAVPFRRAEDIELPTFQKKRFDRLLSELTKQNTSHI